MTLRLDGTKKKGGGEEGWRTEWPKGRALAADEGWVDVESRREHADQRL